MLKNRNSCSIAVLTISIRRSPLSSLKATRSSIWPCNAFLMMTILRSVQKYQDKISKLRRAKRKRTMILQMMTMTTTICLFRHPQAISSRKFSGRTILTISSNMKIWRKQGWSRYKELTECKLSNRRSRWSKRRSLTNHMKNIKLNKKYK